MSERRELKPMLCLPWAAHGPEVYAMGREDLITAGVKTYDEALAHPEIKVQPERICICDFESPYASDQKQIDAEYRAQFIAQLANTRAGSSGVGADEIARVTAIFDGWIERYEHGAPIQFTPAREYAADAVRDCRDAVLLLLTRGRAGKTEPLDHSVVDPTSIRDGSLCGEPLLNPTSSRTEASASERGDRP